MDFDKGESPASVFVGDGQDDNPLPADLNKYRQEIKLPPESWWVRAIRIAVVAVIACWIVAGIAIFIVR
jgi:hypothetical protein